MAERKSFLLRIDPTILDALQRWADAELRSLNGQIEFVLRRSLEDAGRLKRGASDGRRAVAAVRGEVGKSDPAKGTTFSSKPGWSGP